jgi:hypothetical protein
MIHRPTGATLIFYAVAPGPLMAAILILRNPGLAEANRIAAEVPMAKAGWVQTQAFEWFAAEGVMPEKKQRQLIRQKHLNL